MCVCVCKYAIYFTATTNVLNYFITTNYFNDSRHWAKQMDRMFVLVKYEFIIWSQHSDYLPIKKERNQYLSFWAQFLSVWSRIQPRFLSVYIYKWGSLFFIRVYCLSSAFSAAYTWECGLNHSSNVFLLPSL